MSHFSDEKVDSEAKRLHSMLGAIGRTPEHCLSIAPMTLRIKQLASEQNAVLLGHTYVTPEVIFGVCDHRGDSLGLSRIARDTGAEKIVFCGVRFMGETAKLISPNKTVIIPAPDAGCSLSDSITGADVRALRSKYPDSGFVCYVNTSAEVKAECGICCTSANAVAVVRSLPNPSVVFLPDNNMGINLRPFTDKEIITHDGFCIVHQCYTPTAIRNLKSLHPRAPILVHTESPTSVVALADLAGGTSDMVKFVRESNAKDFIIVTEAGMADRFKVEFPDREFHTQPVYCPHMKRIDLDNVLSALSAPSHEQIIEIPEEIAVRAVRSIDAMFTATEKGTSKRRPHSNAGDVSN